MIKQLKLASLTIIIARRLELFKAVRSVVDREIDDYVLERIINTIPNNWFLIQSERKNDQLIKSITLEEIINENKKILDLIASHLCTKIS